MNYSEFNDEDFQYNEREDFHHNLDETINIIEIWLQNESPKNFDTSKSKEIIKKSLGQVSAVLNRFQQEYC